MLRPRSTIGDPAKATSLDRVKASRHAEVGRRYAWQALQRCKGNSPERIRNLVRLRELERFYRHRWGYFLPDDDAGREDLEIAANHIAGLHGEVEKHIIAWAARWCPWMSHDEAKELAQRVTANPRRYKAATLGWRLSLTEIERTRLAITTIRAAGMTDESMKARRQRLARERKTRWLQRKRMAKAKPISHQKPWQACGISRATWYRRRKASSEVAVRQNVERSRGPSSAAHRICLTLPKSSDEMKPRSLNHLTTSSLGGYFEIQPAEKNWVGGSP